MEIHSHVSPGFLWVEHVKDFVGDKVNADEFEICGTPVWLPIGVVMVLAVLTNVVVDLIPKQVKQDLL